MNVVAPAQGGRHRPLRLGYRGTRGWCRCGCNRCRCRRWSFCVGYDALSHALPCVMYSLRRTVCRPQSRAEIRTCEPLRCSHVACTAIPQRLHCMHVYWFSRGPFAVACAAAPGGEDAAPVASSASGVAALGQSSAGAGAGKGSFQVLSIDDRGLVNFWVAVDLPGEDW